MGSKVSIQSCVSDQYVLTKEVGSSPDLPLPHHLVGLVVKVFASRAADPGFDSCLCCEDLSLSD